MTSSQIFPEGSISFTSTGHTGTVVDLMSNYRTSANVTVLTTSLPAEYAVVSSHLNGGHVYASSSSEATLSRLILDSGKVAGTSYSTAPTASTFNFTSSALWESL